MRSLLKKALFDLVKRVRENLRKKHREETTYLHDLFFGRSFELRVEKERREAIERNFIGSVISIKISILVIF